MKNCNFSKSNLDTVTLNQCSILENKFIDTKIMGMYEQYLWGYTKFKKCKFDIMNVDSCIDFIECLFEKCSLKGAQIKCT